MVLHLGRCTKPPIASVNTCVRAYKKYRIDKTSRYTIRARHWRKNGLLSGPLFFTARQWCFDDASSIKHVPQLLVPSRVLSNIRECFNCNDNWIDLSSLRVKHRRTRRPWPQPADGWQDVGRRNPAHGAHQCWYVHSCLNDLTYEATSRFFRTGREQEQENAGRLECLGRPRISSGILSRLLAPEYPYRTPRLLVTFFFVPFFFFWHFYFQCYIHPERSKSALTDTLCASRELFPMHDCK